MTEDLQGPQVHNIYKPSILKEVIVRRYKGFHQLQKLLQRMLLANFKIRISCPWSSTLRDKGIRSQILQCIPRYDAPSTSILAIFITSESRPFELKSLLLESPGVEEVALRRTSRENVMLALIKAKRCACFSAGIPFKHVVGIKEEEKGFGCHTHLQRRQRVQRFRL